MNTEIYDWIKRFHVVKRFDTSGKRFVIEDCILNIRQYLESNEEKRRDWQLEGGFILEERQRQETKYWLVLTGSRRALSLATPSRDNIIPYLSLSDSDRAEMEC